jgi:peptide/nickel transport system substrate-binding protein
MKRKVLWLILSCLMALSLVLVSCGTKTTPTTTPTSTPTTKPTTPPTTATTKPTTTVTSTPSAQVPQYGGTLTMRIDADPNQFDPYYNPVQTRIGSIFMETLARRNLAIDPKIWDHKVKFPAVQYSTGLLAESWEQPDTKTLIVHIRKGVTWQNKPPMNGREFIASDVEFFYHRMRGLGSGFTKPSPFRPYGQAITDLESVTATDKYTVVFKTKSPQPSLLFEILDPLHDGVNMVPKEVVQQYGDMQDWRRAVGTGSFTLDDYVSGSSVSLSRNPNYWGYDDRYPQNRLPYVDSLKFIVIPDVATTLAGLRTGKVDLIAGAASATDDLTWQSAQSITKTNPELLQLTRPLRGDGIGMRLDKAPFTDIRVRKALQMALDLPTIAKTFYGGFVDTIPAPNLSPSMKGYYSPYDEWAPDVQAGYTYNPDGAKKLLTEAGFSNGLKTNVVVSSTADLDLMQVIKAYFLAIGVDMEIRVMDPTSFTSFTQGMKHDALFGTNTAFPITPNNQIRKWMTDSPIKPAFNYTGFSNAIYDDLATRVQSTFDPVEQTKLTKEADYYAVKNQLVIAVLPKLGFDVYQPWVMGFTAPIEPRGSEYARWWIDQNLKKSLGK